MKKIVFIYSKMIIGGSTTSLLSILDMLDRTKFDITLVLFWSGGELFNYIPDDVKVIVLLDTPLKERWHEIRKYLSIRYIFKYCYSYCLGWKIHSRELMGQYLGFEYTRFFKKIKYSFDIGVSCMEFGPCVYLANSIIAKKKIAWIHRNYKEGHLVPNVESPAFEKMQSIVHVSDACKFAFDEIYPVFADRSIVIPNILSRNVILKRATEQIDISIPMKKNGIRMVTTARIDFSSKAFDRTLKILNEIESEQGKQNFEWYIIGDGPDYEKLNELIKKYDLGKKIVLVGAMVNPYPLMRNMDVFLLLSRFEGKPISVTEAQILGIPVIVTNYASSYHQVQNGIDGIIVNNDECSIKNVLISLLTGEIRLNELHNNMINGKYSNEEVISIIENELFNVDI